MEEVKLYRCVNSTTGLGFSTTGLLYEYDEEATRNAPLGRAMHDWICKWVDGDLPLLTPAWHEQFKEFYFDEKIRQEILLARMILAAIPKHWTAKGVRSRILLAKDLCGVQDNTGPLEIWEAIAKFLEEKDQAK